MCAANINVGKLAGSILHRVRQGDVCELDAIGPNAQHKALKSLVMANRYLQLEMAGNYLAFRLERVARPAIGAAPETSLLRFRMELLPGLLPPARPPDLLVARDTNPGLMAGDLMKVFHTKRVVTVVGMGPVAMSRAFKTLLIAQVFLNGSGDGDVLLAAPQSEQVRVGGEERARFMLICTRDSAIQ